MLWERGLDWDGPPLTWVNARYVAEHDAVHLSVDGTLHVLDPASGAVRWRAPLALDASFEPVAAGGLVITDDGSAIVARDARDGAVAWRHPLAENRSAVATAAAADMVVVVEVEQRSDGASELVGLEARTGRERWRRSPPHDGTGAVFAGPLAAGDDGVVAAWHSRPTVGPLEGTLLSLDAATGALRWQAEAAPGPTVAVGHGQVYTSRFVSGTPHRCELVALDAAAGGLRWSVPAGWDCPSVAVGRGALVAAVAGDIVAFDPATGAERWRVRTPGEAHGVAVAGDLVLAIGGDPGLIALDADTGAQRWRVTTPDDAGVDVTGGDGVVVVSLSGQGVLGLDPASGRERWRFRSYPAAGCVLSLLDGDVVVSTGSRVRAFAAGDGAPRWSMALRELSGGFALPPAPSERGLYVAATSWSDPPTASPVYALGRSEEGQRWRAERPGNPGGVAVAAGDSVFLAEQLPSSAVTQLTALDADTGEERWSSSRSLTYHWAGPAGPHTAGPAVVGERVLVIDEHGELTALAASDGAAQWTYLPPGDPQRWRGPVAGRDVALLARGRELHAVGLQRGTNRWRHTLPAPVSGEPAVADGTVLVGAGYELVALAVSDGVVRWRHRLDAPAGAGVSVAGGVVYAATEAGIEAVDLASGALLDSLVTDRAPLVPPVLADGSLFACLGDGTLRAYG